MLKKALLSTVIAVTSVTPVMAYNNQNSIYDETVLAKNTYSKSDLNLNIGSQSMFFTNTDGVNYAQLRNACELFGYDIDWNQKDRSITILKEDTKFVVSIDKTGLIENDKKIKTEHKPILINSTTYIPLEIYDIIFKSEMGYIGNGKNSEISKEIITMMEDLYANQMELNEEYEKAYVETGGNLDDHRPYYFEIGYDVLNSKDVLSVLVYRYQSLASSFTEENYLNYDSSTFEPIYLSDIFGDDYEKELRAEIASMIKEREEADPQSELYFFEEFEKAPIDDSRSFYFNKDNDVVIVFDKYEIGVGYLGKQEFVLKDNSKVNEFKANNKNKFYTTRFNKFQNYLDLYDFENNYNLLGYNNIEVLNIFGSPEVIDVKDIEFLDDSYTTYLYRVNSEDSSYVYINFENNKVIDYKIDEFNGSF